MFIISDPGAIRAKMIKEGLEEIHEFKCSCRICIKGGEPFFEEVEQLINKCIKKLSGETNYRDYQKAQEFLQNKFDGINNAKSIKLNDYAISSFITTHVLETIAYQCSFPFFFK